MRIKKLITVALATVLALGLWPGGPAVCQDTRTLTLGSLRLSAGEGAWLGYPGNNGSGSPGYGLSPQLRIKRSSLLEINRPLDRELTHMEPLGSDNLSYNMNQKVGRVFSLSLALSNIKHLESGAPGAIRTFSARPGQETRNEESGWSDLWALDVGLDYRDPSGHGVHLGFLHGTDPLTREVDLSQPDKQGVDLAYSYDLDGFYVNLGYVYTFSPLWNNGPTETSDSAFYLRFQLHF